MTVELMVALTEEQEMLLDASARFMAASCPLERVRQRADDGAQAMDRDYFRTAGSLGWFGMLASDAAGGGSVSGDGVVDAALLAPAAGGGLSVARNGVVDAALIAAERGAALQPGDFVGANIVAHALSSSSTDHQQV